MIRLLAIFLAIAPLLGWADEKDEPKDLKSPKAFRVLFALKRVHPENERLLVEIQAGGVIPPGFELFQMNVTDEDNKKVGETPILLSKGNIIDRSSIKLAQDAGQPGTVIVALDGKGGKLLNAATKNMKLGKDRMAIVFEDRCLLAPVVMAHLSDTFIIQGLDGRKEVDHVVKVLNGKDKK